MIETTEEAVDVTALATTWMVEHCPTSAEFSNIQNAYKAGFTAALGSAPPAVGIKELPVAWRWRGIHWHEKTDWQLSLIPIEDPDGKISPGQSDNRNLGLHLQRQKR